MASRRVQRQYAFVLSVLGHAAIVAALTFSIPLSSRNRPAGGQTVILRFQGFETGHPIRHRNALLGGQTVRQAAYQLINEIRIV